jgi:peptidyl-tRNA hydrolase
VVNKLYVLVRGDLTTSQQACQACHVVAEFMMEHSTWKNETIVLLKVKNEEELMKWEQKFWSNQYPYSRFCEPDMDGQMTAVAANHPELPMVLKNLNLV